MSQRELKNVPASVRARLLNEAKASGDSYDQVPFRLREPIEEPLDREVLEQYPGVRVVVRGSLDGGTFKLQLDIGIDDAVVPDPEWVEYPTLLDLEAPRVLAYRPVTALAEKFETIVSRGLANSRLRDYYDLWLLPTLGTYEGTQVATAVGATFGHRGTDVPADVPVGLSSAFFGDPVNQAAWRSFLSGRRVEAPSDLEDVCEAIIAFIMPPAAAAASESSYSSMWNPSSGWS